MLTVPVHSLKSIGRDLRSKFRESKARFLRRCGILKSSWSAALPAEVAFWENALRDSGRQWSLEEYQKRVDPHSELQDELKQLVDAPPGATVRLLDVGAGPLTTLGKRWTGRTLEIVPLDPLADAYDKVLGRLNIHPPVRTRFGYGEKLLEYFEPDHFDLAYASNALDHSYDPLAAISQMLAVTKPTRFVYLWHFANEGLQEGYDGLHQWNFDVSRTGTDFLIDDGRRTVSLASHVEGQARLECHTITAFGKRVVIVKLQKLSCRELS